MGAVIVSNTQNYNDNKSQNDKFFLEHAFTVLIINAKHNIAIDKKSPLTLSGDGLRLLLG